MKIAYLHGLESSIKPKDPKIIFLNNNFDEVYTPSINYKDDKTFDKLFKHISRMQPDLIVGSSMGGYVSYLIGSKLSIPVLLFNPAMVGRSFDPVVDDSNLKRTKIEVMFGKGDSVISGKDVRKYFRDNGVAFNHSGYDGGHRVPEDVFINSIKGLTGIKEIYNVQNNIKMMKKFEQFVKEKHEDVGKYNTVKKVIDKLGRRPSEQDLATFINNNYYDVTEVERGDDDPSANDKIADLVAFYKFDIDDWEIAWADAQNESVVNEAKKYKFKDLAKAWEFVYGEDMEDEYEGFYQEVTGKYKNKVTKKDVADIWQKLYGEDIEAEYDGFFSSIKEAVTEAKNTIGLAFKEEQDYLDFKEFVAEQPRGAIRKNIGFDSKTKSWEVIMDVKVLDSIYGEGTSGNKESGWYGGLPDDFESVIIESLVTESEYQGMIAGDVAEDIAKELSYNVKQIVKQPNDSVTYFQVKDKSSVNKTIQSLIDLYGIEAQSGGKQFSPSITVKFDNDQMVSESVVTEGKDAKKDTKKIIKLINQNIKAGSDRDDAITDVLLDGGYFDETSDEYTAYVASIDSKLVAEESVVTEAKDNLYLQLHKKYAEQIKGLKAKKIKKLTDLVSVQRWSMEEREDYFGMDSKKKKELSAEYNEERKLFKKYIGGDESVMLPKGTEALAESVVNEASKDRMIKQIERALKDGDSIFKLPMATQKYYNKNKSDFKSVVTEAVNLKSAHLSSAQYQKAKKLKAFSSDDWVWNSNTSLYDRVDESVIDEAVKIETERYVRSHGKKPKGFGGWMFSYNRDGSDEWQIPNGMSWPDAQKWAKNKAKEDGEDYVYVMESVVTEGKMPNKFIGNDEIVFLKTKENSRGAHYNLYYKGHDIDLGGQSFKSEKDLKSFADNYILSNQWYNKLKYEDSKPLPESVVTETKDMTFTDYLEVLDVKFEDAIAAVRGENGSDAEITPTRGDILQNFTLFRNYISSLTKKYKGNKTKLRFLTEKVNEYIGIINESVVNEGKGAANYFDDLKYNYTKTLRHLDKDEKKEYNKLAKDFFSKIAESTINEGKFDNIADLVKSLHFETDPKTAEEKKIELGKRQGEVSKRKQIEGGEYSLRRFRKEIKFGDGTYLGVFLPGSYDASVSTLGDGPHKKAVARVKWSQKKYDQWLEDMAANGGADNAFDMAQNAKNEPGLINWVKKEFRGDDPLQRIQWDIEAFAESVVTEDSNIKDKHKIMKTFEQFVNEKTSFSQMKKDSKTKEYKEVSQAINNAEEVADIWNMLDPKMFKFTESEFEDIFDEWFNNQMRYDSVADFSRNAFWEDAHSLYLHLLPYVSESVVNEASQEAYTLHRLADNPGEEVAAEFLASNNIDLELLAKAIQQGTINKYELRDVVNGSAPKSKIKRFLKEFTNESLVTETVYHPYDFTGMWAQKLGMTREEYITHFASMTMGIDEADSTDARGKSFKVKGASFTYTERGRFYGVYLYDEPKVANIQWRAKLRTVVEATEFLALNGVDMEVPRDYNEIELDKICKALSKQKIVCDHDMEFDAS